MAVSPTSRRTNIWLVGLLLSVPASKACATDALPACNPLPRIERFTEPTYPPIVERGGMHDPVSVILLFTITSRGAVIAVRVVQIDTEFHADEFAAQYLNRPFSSENQLFKNEYFKYLEISMII